MVYFPKGYALTDKQKLFCDLYIQTLDGYSSAIKAGYSEKRALSHEATIMQLPKVKEYIAMHIREAKESELIKHKSDIDRLARNINKLDIIIDKTIPDIAEYDDKGIEKVSLSSYEVGMKAIDLQAKVFGHYAPTKTANLNVNITKDEETEAKLLLNKLIADNTKDY